jgi:hypothetical protein
MARSTLPPELQHRAWTWHATRLRVAALCIVGLTVYACLYSDADAQATGAEDAARAQQQYELDIAICNTAGFAAPQREACIREAGQRLDRVRNAPPAGSTSDNQDGRATVVADPASASALQGSALQTTTDGRATVVVPAQP